MWEIISAVVAILALLGGAYIHLSKRIDRHTKTEAEDRAAFRDDLMEDRDRLRKELRECEVGRNQLQADLLEMRIELNKLKARVKTLEEENEALKAAAPAPKFVQKV